MNFSIITDFGCPFNCSFCITNSQETKKNFSISKEKLMEIKNLISDKNIRRVSLSGGGDPLYIHSEEIKAFMFEIISFCNKNNIEIHVHTNTMSPIDISKKFDKVVISINETNYLRKYENWKNIKTKRFVHVSDGNDLDLIKKMVLSLDSESQFTVKQMDEQAGEDFIDIESFLNQFENTMFLKSGDYNKYYVLNEGKLYNRFKDITFKGNK